MRKLLNKLCARAHLAAIMLTFLMLYMSTLKAQKFYGPTNAENFLDTLSGVTQVNCDMFDCPVEGGKLLAVCYDSSNYIGLKVWHSSGLAPIYTASYVNGTDPDIIIMDNKDFLGTYYTILLTYVNEGRLKIDELIFTYVNKPNFKCVARRYYTVTPRGVTVRNPKIDAFPDTGTLVNGYPSYKDFIISYVKNNDSLAAIVGNTPSTTTGFNITKLDSNAGNPDVAAITDYVNNNKIAGFVYKSTSGLNYLEKNLTTGVCFTPILLSTNSVIASNPRIDAMNLHDPSATSAKWQVVSSEYNAVTGKWDVHTYDSFMSYDCSNIIGSFGSAYTPVVCAGFGTLGSALFTGNKNYVIGWKQGNSANFYANYVNVNTGKRISSVDTFHYTDTTYIQDTTVLYDTLKFTNTSYITDTSIVYITDTNTVFVTDTSTVYVTNTNVVYVVDTNIVYLTDTIITYVLDTSYVSSGNNGHGNSGNGNNGNGNGNSGRSSNGHGNGRTKTIKLKNGTSMVIDTVEIVTIDTTNSYMVYDTVSNYTVVDTVNQYEVVDSTDNYDVIDTINSYTVIDTVNVIYTDSISVLQRDSIFTVMVTTSKSYTVDQTHFFQINNDSCGGSQPLAMSSATNTGNGLFSVWYDGTYLKYKIVGNTSGFRMGGDDPGGNEEDEYFAHVGPFANKENNNMRNYSMSNIMLYPNPAKSILNVRGIDKGQYVISDITGRQLQAGVLDAGSIDITLLNKGVYIINFKTDTGATKAQRFIKE